MHPTFRAQQTIAVMAAVAGAVGIVGGVTLVVIGWPRSSSSNASIGVTPRGATVTATF